MSATCLIISILAILLLPLGSAILAVLVPNRYRWITPPASIVLHLFTTILSFSIALTRWNAEPFLWSIRWFDLGSNDISIGFLLNNTTLVLLLVVSFVSLMVHLFSVGYMAGDRGEQRYFGMLGFFTAAMLGLVLSDNLLVLFICWELVGFSSYLLIGHWYEKPEAAEAAKKAFIINRVTDLGFVAGLLILWTNTGNFSLSSLIFTGTESWCTAASLCFLLGVMGKSAQVPFFNWLSSAMEGPTPVSALIHAATMVVAGVFLLIRLFLLFTPLVLDVIAVIGCSTALLGAFAALYQVDFKKILAYSTISQLGLMLAALGSGAYGVALLHVFTHAFFKAGLFLGAGSVIHSLHEAQLKNAVQFDVQDIRNLGGLRTAMPITFFCFIISAAALAGLPLFSGFQSKDALLISVFDWSAGTWRSAFFWILVSSSFLTILYTVRMVWFVFLAPSKKTATLTIEEAPPIMRFPVILLSIGSLWWMVSYHPLAFSGWLLEGVQPMASHNIYITWLSFILIPASAVFALLWFRKEKEATSITFLQHGYYLDELNAWLIAKPTTYLGNFSLAVDKRWIDGILHGVAYLITGSAYFIAWVDRTIIDGVVDTTARAAKVLGSVARSFSGGRIQTYIFWSVFSLIIFLFWILF